MPENNALQVRHLTRREFDDVVGWAAQEGWNPGLDDAQIFWDTDPQGFVGAQWRGELVGSGSIVAYGGAFGFMGFFIIRPELRGQGLGAQLWHERVRLLRQRLRAGAPIGMDGVFDMQPFYANGGFTFHHRSPRMAGVGVSCRPDAALAELSSLPFERVAQYDLEHFGYERRAFLKRWIAPAKGLALGVPQGNRLRGMGVVRQCLNGCKIGPLFADDPQTAEMLFDALASHAAGQPLFFDTPENNPEALALARRKNMQEVFGCARMYLGVPPQLPHARIYGITTFELG